MGTLIQISRRDGHRMEQAINSAVNNNVGKVTKALNKNPAGVVGSIYTTGPKASLTIAKKVAPGGDYSAADAVVGGAGYGVAAGTMVCGAVGGALGGPVGALAGSAVCGAVGGGVGAAVGSVQHSNTVNKKKNNNKSNKTKK